jgi:hypothetical protein
MAAAIGTSEGMMHSEANPASRCAAIHSRPAFSPAVGLSNVWSIMAANVEASIV